MTGTADHPVFLISDDDDPSGLHGLAHGTDPGPLLRVGFGRTSHFLGRPNRVVGAARWLLGQIRPQILHADGPSAARYVYLLSRLALKPPVPFRTVVSGVRAVEPGVTGWLTRRAINAADRVIAGTAAAAGTLVAAGVPRERLAVIPAAAPPLPAAPDRAAFRTALGIPTAARVIVAAGPFAGAFGLRAAVWDFDLLRQILPDVYLVVVGDGPGRDGVERFVRSVMFDDERVRFAPGGRADFAAAAQAADIVWLTEGAGVRAALTAMAAGTPVVAPHSPDFAAVLTDGVTGRLVPPRDRTRLGAAALDLLEHPAAAAALADAARREARQFTPAAVVAAFSAVYDELARGSP